MTAARLGFFARGLAIGCLGGGAFYWLTLPLPWVMGAMAATIVAGATGVPSYMPRPVRNAVIPALGVMFGGAFNSDTLAYLPDLWPLPVLTLVYLIFVIAAGSVFFTRLGRLDLPTAYFASVPGSFSQMVFLAEDWHADLSAIAIVHATRLVVSLTLITLGFRTILGIDTTVIAGAKEAAPGVVDLALMVACAVLGVFGGRAVRLPSAHLFGPLILSAAAHLVGIVHGVPPRWTVALAQVFIGIFIGLRFAGVQFVTVRRLLAISVLWTLFLLVMALSMAAALVLILDLPLEAAFLAFAPGGAVEISVIALAAGVNLSLITIIQFVRISLTVGLAPLAFRWLLRGKRQD